MRISDWSSDVCSSDLAEARKAADLQLSALLAGQKARDAGYEAQIAGLKDAQAALTAQFREVGQAMLDGAQKAFLERADARFKQSEERAGQNLNALLTPDRKNSVDGKGVNVSEKLE